MTTTIPNKQIRDGAVTAEKLNLTLDEISAPIDSLDLNSQKIINVGTPTVSSDGASKGYVDAQVTAATEGLTLKGSVTAATTAALPACTYDNGTAGVGATLTGNANGALAAQDGVTLEEFELLLVKNEADPVVNGIYKLDLVGDGSNPFELTRVAYFDSAANILPNSHVFVSEGSTLAETGWALNIDSDAVVGTTDLVFTQFSGTGQITAGSGLSKSGNTLNANVDDSTIAISSDNIIVKSGGITATQLASDAVTTAKILDSNVTTGKLADGSVTFAKVADANITLGKIANASANSKLLGSTSSGSGASYAEITLGTGLTMSGGTLNATAALNIAENEVPSGTINGTNPTFTLAHTPAAGTLKLYNGLRLKPGAGNDYTISSDTITFLTGAIPEVGDNLLADYSY